MLRQMIRLHGLVLIVCHIYQGLTLICSQRLSITSEEEEIVSDCGSF